MKSKKSAPPTASARPEFAKSEVSTDRPASSPGTSTPTTTPKLRNGSKNSKSCTQIPQGSERTVPGPLRKIRPHGRSLHDRQSPHLPRRTRQSRTQPRPPHQAAQQRQRIQPPEESRKCTLILASFKGKAQEVAMALPRKKSIVEILSLGRNFATDVSLDKAGYEAWSIGRDISQPETGSLRLPRSRPLDRHPRQL